MAIDYRLMIIVTIMETGMMMIMVMMVMMVIMVMMMIAWWLKQGKLKDFCRESRRVSSRFYPPTKTCGAEGGTKS